MSKTWDTLDVAEARRISDTTVAFALLLSGTPT